MSRSTVTGFFINKQVTGADTSFDGLDYNRVGGLEYNLASPDGRWTGKAFYHQSFYEGANADAATFAGDILYSTRFFRASIASSWIGAYYIAEMGYIRRTGYFGITPSVKYTFYPSNSSVLSHGPSLSFNAVFDTDFEMTDRSTSFGYLIGFQNRSSISISGSEDFVLLDRPFDPTNTDGVKLPAGTSYDWWTAGIGYNSDSRKLFSYSADVEYGSYYNGTKLSLSGSLGYRYQPYGSIAVSANYNNLELPPPYNSAELVLIGPRLDVTFTDMVFLTAFFQYNDQVDNFNTNIRFQWRFAPVSDLFIVYTGNSYATDLLNKDRGVVIKISYWFN